MADDTRQQDSTPEAAVTKVPYKPPPKPRYEYPKTQAGKMWEAFGNPSEPINTIPGGTYNSAGGKPKEVTYWNALTSLDLFNSEGKPAFYQTSCARDSLMVGIGAGGAVGGLRFILKGD
jgi:cytochrome c oxidase assembly protein subunit 20